MLDIATAKLIKDFIYQQASIKLSIDEVRKMVEIPCVKSTYHILALQKASETILVWFEFIGTTFHPLDVKLKSW